MRNTLKHQITRYEILSAIDTALQREIDDDRIGDVDGMILQRLYDRLANNEHLLRNVFGGDEHFKV